MLNFSQRTVIVVDNQDGKNNILDKYKNIVLEND